MTVVRRVCVLDSSSQACLFDEVREWNGDRASETVAGLVRSFFQFASELGEDGVIKVKFSSASAKNGKHHNRSRSRTGPVLGSQRKSNIEETMYLQCLKGVHGLVVAFTQNSLNDPEGNSESVLEFLKSVDTAFGESKDDKVRLKNLLDNAIITLDQTGTPIIKEEEETAQQQQGQTQLTTL